MMNKQRLRIFALAVTFSIGGAFSLLAQQKNMPDEGLALPEGEPTMPATASPGETKGLPDFSSRGTMMQFLSLELDLTEEQIQKLHELEATHMKQHSLVGRMHRPIDNPMAGRPMHQGVQAMFRGRAPMPSRGHRRMGPIGIRGPMGPGSEARPFWGDPHPFSGHPRGFFGGGPGAFRGRIGMNAEELLKGISVELELTEEQREKIVTIFEQSQDVGSKKAQNFLDMRRTMADFLKQDEFDEQQVRELFRQHSAQMEERFVKRAKMLAEIKEVLSSEQIDILQERGEIFLDMMER